ncbi:MAG: hypothetical protein JO235_11915 [Chroococcidiopsidaceae cyanobacterium CP_BM_RX_35]|nr:hypothetical protein [Chroococcidiopsidaceae cyanobacterium CP_BM_RX_35]
MLAVDNPRQVPLHQVASSDLTRFIVLLRHMPPAHATKWQRVGIFLPVTVS